MDNTVLFDLSYGVYAVTTWDEGRAVGCIANSAMQVTAEPMTIAVSINKNNHTHKAVEEMGRFALSILSEKSDPAIIGAFGFKSAADKAVEKFDGVGQKLVSYLPAVADSCGCLIVEVKKTFDCGTHTIFFGDIVEAERFSKEPPMTYSYYHKVIKGKSPKNAPTYQPEEEKKSGKAFVCDVCGYVYEGESVPDGFICPVCGMNKDHFKIKEDK